MVDNIGLVSALEKGQPCIDNTEMGRGIPDNVRTMQTELSLSAQ